MIKWSKAFFLSFLVFLLFPLASVFADSTPVDFVSGSNFESAFNALNQHLSDFLTYMQTAFFKYFFVYMFIAVLFGVFLAFFMFTMFKIFTRS